MRAHSDPVVIASGDGMGFRKFFWADNEGEMPVPHGTLVDVIHRDDAAFYRVPAGGSYHDVSAEDWTIDGTDGDIVKWRRSI